MRHSRLLQWILCGLLFVGAGSCASTSPSRTSDQQELEFWTMQLQPQFTSYFNERIAAFEAEHGAAKLRWIDVPWNAMESKILAAVSAQTAPDVVNLNPNFASQLAARKAWLDLDAVIPKEIQQRYLPNIWQASVIGGKSFGIPWYLTTRVTIFNRALLADANLEQPPETFTQLAKMAAQLKERTGKYAFFVTFVPGDSGEVLESLVQMGVVLLDGQGKAAFNSAMGQTAFRYWVDLYQQGLLPPEVLTQGHRQAVELYQAGELALLSSGAEFLNTIATNAPSIAKVSGAAPQITGVTQKRNVAVMNLVIPRNTKQQEMALKFALFMTNTDNQLAFAKTANVLPSTLAGIETYIQELDQQDNPSAVEQARQISARQLKETEVLVPAQKHLNQLQKLIYENLQAAMLGQKTIEQALEDAANRWDQEFAPALDS